MQVDAIVKRCNEFICEYLPTNPSSPLLEYIYTYEMGISPEEILLKVKSQLESVYTETIEKYVFLRTTFTQLLTIISNRELNARDEYAIVKCVVMWVLYDVEDRLTHVNALLELVDCGKSMMLKIISAIEVPREVPGAIMSSSKSLCHVSEDGIYNSATKERLVQYNFGVINNVIYTTKQLLFILSFSGGKMYKYNNATKEVVVCSYPTNYYFDSSSTVNETSDGRLVVIGGSRGNGSFSNEMRYYDIANDSWYKGQSLPYYVGWHTTVVDGDDIYVIGGNVNKVIRYRNGRWQTLSHLLNNRRWHIAMLDDNCIYVYGGDNRTDCECYDILTDQWSVVDNAVYTNIKSTNSVIDVNKRLLYTHEDVNVFYISLDNNTNYLLCENVSCHRLVLMHV